MSFSAWRAFVNSCHCSYIRVQSLSPFCVITCFSVFGQARLNCTDIRGCDVSPMGEMWSEPPRWQKSSRRRRMSFRPGLANLASVIADTGREAILVALADGRALPAGELAEIAGVSPQSASRHLQKMVEGQLLEVWTQGRFRYYRLASEEIAALLEAMSAIASRSETNQLGGARSSRLPRSLCEAR